jgi:hypothetical protein
MIFLYQLKSYRKKFCTFIKELTFIYLFIIIFFNEKFDIKYIRIIFLKLIIN